MNSIFIEKIVNYLSSINPALIFLFIFLTGLIIFWRGGVESRKERSSIFDMFFISSLFSLASARITYIIYNWSSFSGYIWYWLPYEKYGEDIFLFRLLPWRFFNIFDGGVEILIMFVSFLLFASIGVLFIKKWRWRDMFQVIFFSAEVMLAMSFLFSGLASENITWITQAGVLLIPIILIYIIITFVTEKTEGKEEKTLFIVTNLFLIALSSGFILYIYLTNEISMAEKLGCFIFLAWTVLGMFFFVKDIKKSVLTIERVSSVRTISSADINQPIRLSK